MGGTSSLDLSGVPILPDHLPHRGLRHRRDHLRLPRAVLVAHSRHAWLFAHQAQFRHTRLVCRTARTDAHNRDIFALLSPTQPSSNSRSYPTMAIPFFVLRFDSRGDLIHPQSHVRIMVHHHAAWPPAHTTLRTSCG